MTPAARLQTFADLVRLEARTGKAYELIDGVIIEKAAPDFGHGRSQRRVGHLLDPFDSGGPPPPGGVSWWLGSEVDTELTPRRVVRPDVAGWRRDRATLAQLEGRPVLVIPDWVCEIVSPSNRAHDLVTKVELYQAARVPHYWILDPTLRTLIVHRWSEVGYVTALVAVAGQQVRAEPFDAMELTVDALLGAK